MEVYENPPRHTAKQVPEDVAAGMDPDVELVAAQYYDQMKAARDRAVGALERAGFVDHGAEAWKPPLGWGDTGTQRERLIALEDQLARVKAESIRVVESECQDMNIASDWYMTPDGLGWLGYDRHDCECVETSHGYHKFDECRKVKLERWEDE